MRLRSAAAATAPAALPAGAPGGRAGAGASGDGLLDRVVSRAPMHGHAGRSGALLERAVLDDGRRVVIKTASPELDLVMVVSGDADGRERRLWDLGVLDRLPAGVDHCILDAPLEEDGRVVTVMTDLGDDIVDWDDHLSVADSERIIDATARMHVALEARAGVTGWAGDGIGAIVPPLLPLARWLTQLSSDVMADHAGGPNPIAGAAVRGWRLLRELAPPAIADAVAAVHADPVPFADRLRTHRVTLLHGDLWPVNLALRSDAVVLLDWGLATAGPGTIDLATFVTASRDLAGSDPDALVERYVDATGCAPGAVADGFLAALCVFGWNEALTVVSTGDRRRLDWWVDRCRRR